MKKSLLVLFCFLSASLPVLAATPPSVTLTWPASTTASTTTNVYRLTGTCPASVTTTTGFTELASSQPAAGPYTDTNVTLGTTYCYVVTAVAGGLESVPSNTFQAVFPGAPAAPKGLTGTVTP